MQKISKYLVYLLLSSFLVTAVPLAQAVSPEGYSTVTFDANTGTGTISSQVVTTGTSITIPTISGISKVNNVFTGWNTLANGTGA